MGLLFPLEIQSAQSSEEKLVLASTRRKMWLGGTMLFAAALVGTMSLAAAPIFRAFWSEGEFLDKFIAGFFYFIVAAFPVFAVLCWFFEDFAVLERESNDTLKLTFFRTLPGLRFGHKEFSGLRLSEFAVENEKGALNVAALRAEESGQRERYATKGHWLLVWRRGENMQILERRAYQDEVEELRDRIQSHFRSN